MKKNHLIILLVLGLIALVWVMAPWRRSPAEDIGEKLDQAAHDTRDTLRDAGHDIKHDLTH